MKGGKKDDGILEQWILYLKHLPNGEAGKLINTIEEGEKFNALHIAAIRNDAETLEELIEVGGGMFVCAQCEVSCAYVCHTCITYFVYSLII